MSRKFLCYYLSKNICIYIYIHQKSLSLSNILTKVASIERQRKRKEKEKKEAVKQQKLDNIRAFVIPRTQLVGHG